MGITKQKFLNRLSQHRNPTPNNKTPIAKLQRYLKNIDMSLYGEIIISGCQEEIEEAEKDMIKLLKSANNGRLKNVQDGGLNNFKNTPEIIKKVNETKKLNREKNLHKSREGENNTSSKVNEKTVLLIYDLIKTFHSNNEIIENLKLNIGLTGLNQIRQGKVWKYLWKREEMYIVPSTHKEQNGLPTREKLNVINKLLKDENLENLKEEYPKLSITDLKRIKEKKIWKPIWNLYNNFIIKTNN